MTSTENNQPIEFNSALKLDANFQRDCDEFVYKHIERNADELIDMLLSITDHEYMAHSDAAMNIAYRPLTTDDYIDQYNGEKEFSPKFIDGKYIVIDAWSDGNSQEAFGCELEAWQHSYNEQSLDEPDRKEALEFWAVSNDLAHWLDEYDQAINHDILGFSIWGRVTSGQAISMDSVIQRIFWDRLDDSERASFIQKLES